MLKKATAAVLATLSLCAAPVQAAEAPTTPPWLDAIKKYGDTVRVQQVYSPAMERNIPVLVSPAKHPQRPTLYLLNGADGGEGEMNWASKTDAIEFYQDKDINLVIPMAGKYSYYTDWATDIEQLGGKQRWETFLTKELPGPLEASLNANGKRAVTGMSMSATSSLLLAEHNPGFYNAVGSFSGCAETNTGLGQFALIVTLLLRGAQWPETMWGPLGSETRRHNDVLANVENLRGTEVYVSNGSGLAGRWDLWSSPFVTPKLTVQTHVVNGGIIEAISNICTHNLKAKMDAKGVPATFNFTNNGTHSWGYWQDQLRASWPTIARGLGVE